MSLITSVMRVSLIAPHLFDVCHIGANQHQKRLEIVAATTRFHMSSAQVHAIRRVNGDGSSTQRHNSNPKCVWPGLAPLRGLGDK